MCVSFETVAKIQHTKFCKLQSAVHELLRKKAFFLIYRSNILACSRTAHKQNFSWEQFYNPSISVERKQQL